MHVNALPARSPPQPSPSRCATPLPPVVRPRGARTRALQRKNPTPWPAETLTSRDVGAVSDTILIKRLMLPVKTLNGGLSSEDKLVWLLRACLDQAISRFHSMLDVYFIVRMQWIRILCASSGQILLS